MKKGIQTPIIIAGVVVVIIALALLVPLVTAGGTATNLNPDTDCKLQLYNYAVTGDLKIVDGAIFGVEPEIETIENVGFKPLATIEPFDYQVELYDLTSGEKLSSYKGTASLSSDVPSKNVPFQLPFTVRDCDGLYTANLEIRAVTIETKDLVLDSSSKDLTINIEEGRLLG